MPNLTGRTGNATVDRQNREFARGGQQVEVTVAGQTRPVNSSIEHLLGYVPTNWHVVSGPPGVSEPDDGIRATRNDITLAFDRNGKWVIEIS